MENTPEASDWIPTSFSTTSDIGEIDSLSSYQSVTTPGSTVAADQQFDDQSFDTISRQKLSLTNVMHDRTSPKGDTVSNLNMFEEDTRSSWSVEPKQTQFKETVIDEDSHSSVKETLKQAILSEEAIQFKEGILDGDLQISPNQTEFRESVVDENSRNSLQEIEFKKTAIDDDSQNCSKETEFKDAVLEEDSQNNSKQALFKENVVMEEDFQNDSKQTQFKEVVLEENSENTSKQSHFKETSIDEDSQPSLKQTDFKETIIDEDSLQNSKQTGFKETAIDEDSRNSVSSHKSSQKRRHSDDEEDKRAFSVEHLFEYMWPQENGEYFFLQEQICDYLNVKSFKRKYPDLSRRPVDMDEKQFLKDKGAVTEMQCDLGLTALRSEEVLELMSKDYPDQYKDYIKYLREKQQQTLSEKHKEYAASSSDKTKMVDLVKKAVQSAAEYNAHLNQERREERRSCMDLQTFTVHYPVKPNKVKTNTKPGKYPVALLPGQYQDYYKGYTSDELKYLPVNTVLYGPLKELNTVQAPSDGSQSDSEDSTASEGSCSSSQGTHDDSSSGSEKNEKCNNNRKSNLTEKLSSRTGSPFRPKIKINAVCKMCKLGPDCKAKNGKIEELVHCSDCDNSAHPSCIELTSDVVDVLKTYPWQCMDCKVCSHCRDPNDEDKMLFCDLCDRGYHTFCVGLKTLPQGKWVCRQCGSCSVCGVNRPGPENSKVQWQYDTTKTLEMDANRHPKVLCVSCFRKKR